jgi:hypothetical protein
LTELIDSYGELLFFPSWVDPATASLKEGKKRPREGLSYLPRIQIFWNGGEFGAMSIGTYGEPDAVSKAIGYAKFRSRSHDAVIRVYDEAGNVVNLHEHALDFREP